MYINIIQDTHLTEIYLLLFVYSGKFSTFFGMLLFPKKNCIDRHQLLSSRI